jgi:hypothetical protein
LIEGQEFDKGGHPKVSDNYKFYSAKMAELRAQRGVNRPLQSQLNELFAFVRLCEARWN